ncbi:hypothetical protein JTE90_019419 [Oedothorax gibbosus]|uniref:Uncharacterized protein n=1 Tax=Oedothorax gibbosus TaxID=931172 RepID=A0AAV6TW12_9ARAC|nr:hypothetical protein JTE90_019419 [Oedothorax gibbosus]
MRILLGNQIPNDQLLYADELMLYFVANASVFYGGEFMVYNVHSLIHLADDARKFGSLNRVSTFPFENFLGQLKRLLRSPNKPLQQLCKRIGESGQLLSGYVNNHMPGPNISPIHSTIHADGPCLGIEGVQYRKVEGLGFIIKTQSGDNCMLLKDGSIVLAVNFILREGSLYFVGRRFLKKEPFYLSPCESTNLGIFAVSNLSTIDVWHMNDFHSKGVVLPYRNNFVFFPLLHCFNNFY